MNKAEVFRTVLDTISEFSYADETLMVDEDGQATELALELSRAIANSLDGEL